MNDRLNGIDVFAQVVEAGSFSLAAERLHLTRSAVAKTIARLEQRLGTRLFHRTTRTQSLTEGGQGFYEHCVRALAELETGEAALESGRREPKGLLRISAPVLFGRQCIAPALLELAAKHTNLKIDMSFSDRVVDIVNEGYDIAVRVGSLVDSSTLASRHIGVQRMMVCASPAYLAKHGNPHSLEALGQHVGIVYGRDGRQVPWRLHEEDGRIHDVIITARLRLDDLQAIADAAVAGLGLAWLPCWLIARSVQSGELVQVFACNRVAPTDIHAVWPQTRYLPAKTRAAIDLLVAEVPRRMASPLEANKIEHAESVLGSAASVA